MNIVVAPGHLARVPAPDRGRWLALASVLLVVAVVCMSSSSIWGIFLGTIIGAFGLGAFLGRRPFYIFSGAFILAVTGVTSCAAIESSLHEKTCDGTTEVFWNPAPEPEDFICHLG